MLIEGHALHLAVELGHEAVLEALLAVEGVDKDYRDKATVRPFLPQRRGSGGWRRPSHRRCWSAQPSTAASSHQPAAHCDAALLVAGTDDAAHEGGGARARQLPRAPAECRGEPSHDQREGGGEGPAAAVSDPPLFRPALCC